MSIIDVVGSTATKVLVIEPHADDAFLSLGHHLASIWETETLAIATVFPETMQRGDEARAYAHSVGASHYCRGEGYEEVKTPTLTALKKWLALIIEEFDPDAVIGPLGIQHEEHKLVAAALPPNAQRYLDVPYAGKLKNGSEVRDLVRGRIVTSFAVPPMPKFNGARFFRSQAKFFYYNTPEALARCPEVIIK